MMRNRTLVWWCLWACLHSLRLQAAFGNDASTPYGDITGNNVFRLKAPELRSATPAPQALADIRLTGITTLLARKLGSFKVRLPATTSEPAQELALSLAEGQSERNIEVVAIDEKAGRVELLHFGTRRVVAFEATTPPQPAPPLTRPLPLRTLPQALNRNS